MSPTPTLYGAPLSPFVRKVRVCLHAKALDYQLEMIMPFSVPDWYLELSPLGRIPAFKDTDGFSVADSSVITQYLEESRPNTLRLYGQSTQEAARIRWFEKYADYEIAPLTTSILFVHRILKPMRGEQGDENLIQQVLNVKLPPHLDYLERQLQMGTNYLVGNQLSMADIALASQFICMEYAGETLASQRWPALNAHFLRIKALKAFSHALEVETPILNQLRTATLGK